MRTVRGILGKEGPTVMNSAAGSRRIAAPAAPGLPTIDDDREAIGGIRRLAKLQLLGLILTAGVFPGTVAADESPKPHLWGERRLPQETVDIKTLRDQCSTGQIAKVPKTFFGDAHDPDLADLVVYISGDTVKRQTTVGLVKDHRPYPKLWGERFLWVLVFVEGTTIKPKSHGEVWKPKEVALTEKPKAGKWHPESRVREGVLERTTPNLKMRFEPLDARRSLAQTTAFNLLGTLLGKFESKPVAEALSDSERQSTLVQLEKADTSKALFYAIEKFPLTENTKNRVRIMLDDNFRTYATFGNYSPARFGASVGVAGSLPAKKLATRADFEMAAYALFHYWIPWRPEAPRIRGYSRPFSLGVFGGVRVGDRPFGNLVVGGSMGNLGGGPVGAFAGWQFTSPDSARKRWSTRVAVGLTYAL